MRRGMLFMVMSASTKRRSEEKVNSPVAVELVVDITTNVNDLSHAGQISTLCDESVSQKTTKEEAATHRTDERIAVEELELSGSG
jgi:hypothetical protein